MRSSRTLFATYSTSAGPSSRSTPTSTSSPEPICPTVAPSTVTDADDTRCTTALTPSRRPLHAERHAGRGGSILCPLCPLCALCPLCLLWQPGRGSHAAPQVG